MPRGGGRGGGSGGRGKKFGHKGGHRHFTSAQELEGQQEEIRKIKEHIGEDEEGGSGDEQNGQPGASKGPLGSRVQIKEISNPNRQKKANIKVTDLDIDISGKPQLSRREKEEMDAAAKKAAYQRLHEKGLTDEAQRDLARLALVRQQREEAARKREAEKASKNASANPPSVTAASAAAAPQKTKK